MAISKDTPETVQDGKVVRMDYELKVDGGVVDKSEKGEPIQFIQGGGQIIPGLEKQIYGMGVGETRSLVISPAEGYGEADANAYADIPRQEFPPNIPLETGVALQLRDQDGQVLNAYIVGVDDQSVKLNFNHPLAGKELHFTVTVLELRDATEEELSHGHVHGEEGEEDEGLEDEEIEMEVDEEFEDEEWEEEDLEDEEFEDEEWDGNGNGPTQL